MINDNGAGHRSRALVLGGGGPVGWAWETGLMDGFAGRGIDLGTANLIIGTSAGAVVGAQLALKQGFGAPPRIDGPPPVFSGQHGRFSHRYGAGGAVSGTGADTRRNRQDGTQCANDQRGSIRFEIDVCSLHRAGLAESIPSRHRKRTNRATQNMGCFFRCPIGTSDSS